MPPKAPQKSKQAKLLAAQSASKSKGKKKWSKGKLREKKNNRVVFTAQLLEKFLKEVPKKMKVITTYNLIEQYKINGSLARRGIRELLKRAFIAPVDINAANSIYTPTELRKKVDKADKEEVAATGKGQKGGKGGKGQKGKQKPKDEEVEETEAPVEDE